MKFKIPSPTRLTLLAALILCVAGGSRALAQGTTAFTYQGQLHDSGTNANGNYAMVFKLYDAPSGGNQIGGTLTNDATLMNGLFTVTLDFGSGAFNGAARWLDISVGTTNGANQIVSLDPLAPRVPVQPAPYALYAGQAGSAANLVSGTWNANVGNYQTFTNVFGIYANNGLILGLSTNGVLVNGGLQVSGLNINNTSFRDDGQGGFQVDGSITCSNLTLNGTSISIPGSSGASMVVSNGDFVFDNNVRITSLGVIHLPTPDGGSVSLTGYGFGSHTLGVDATVQASGLNLTDGVHSDLMTVNASGFYVGGGNFTVNGPVNAQSISAQSGTFTGIVSASAFNTTSDRNAKENFSPVKPAEILARVVGLPISSWNFKTDAATRHLGPMAQDFYSAFKVGTDEKHIATVDEDGVALAAIQGLNQKLEAEAKAKDAKISELEKRLSELETLIKASTVKPGVAQ